MDKVFVSFDFEHDRNYKYLLEAWHNNPKFRFVFEDGTPREINSDNVGRVKAALTLKIKDATHTLVIVGKHANDPHPNRSLIGYKNWINYEIAKSKELGKRIAVIQLERSNILPDELNGAEFSLRFGYTEANIMLALQEAPYQNVYRY